MPGVSFERRAIGAHGAALVSTRLERHGFLAAFTERTGGTSDPPYDSLDLALHVGDDPDRVRDNRRAVCRGLRIAPFAVAEQVHGAAIAKVARDRAGAGFDDPHGVVPGADALRTSAPGVALAVLTADCVPMVAASPRSGLVAAVHAGWRGLAGGIVGATAALFEDPGEVVVALGPCIGPDHYEVGESVVRAVGAGTDAGPVVERRNGRVFLDLAGTIRAELATLGIGSVDDTGVCTACEPERFFSYRRDGTTGRQAGVAVKLSG
ncbi:MAG: peptidoglycan editing factor PgeF [Actinomycetota bacterium]